MGTHHLLLDLVALPLVLASLSTVPSKNKDVHRPRVPPLVHKKERAGRKRRQTRKEEVATDEGRECFAFTVCFRTQQVHTTTEPFPT